MPQELVTSIARALVDTPEAVEVSIVTGFVTTIVKLKVADDEVGQVIGKHGAIADAMRTLLAAMGAKQGRRIHLEIIEGLASEKAEAGVWVSAHRHQR